MMTIKEVSRRSGVSAPTLRYYEEIGLLPETTRTPAGYRTYDESTFARLAFIMRAKDLGCSLDEIADLTTAWEGGRCGPIQDHLRRLVAEKLAAARSKVVELSTLSSDLVRAAAALEQHRPDGACDDRCGCVSDPDPAAYRLDITAKQGPNEPPIACTLDSDALRGQIDDWMASLRHAGSRGHLDGGLRLEMGSATPLDELTRLVAAEQRCCQFLRFAITFDERGVGLEVTGAADAMSIIDGLFGAQV